MAHNMSTLFLSLLHFTFTAYAALSDGSHSWPITDDRAGDIQTYIVFVEEPRGREFLSSQELEAWHMSFLPNVTLDSGEPRLVYSYREAISGFAAKLTREEVWAMEKMEGFLSAEPDQPERLHTTHTPNFLRLEGGMLHTDSIWAESSMGAGIIIGVLDKGARPTHISFDDSQMPAPPAKWKRGACAYKKFKCNNKIIGARAYGSTYADDADGHGTHVASTAAGSFVHDAHVLNNAKGRASGMAPLAHLAIYKSTSGAASTVKAIDDAIIDGVHIISMSLGYGFRDLHAIPVIVASFSAVKKGIFFCASAGNDGPVTSEIENDAPWIMTVGAGTTNRRIKATVRLENGTELVGESGYQPATFNSTMLPIIFPGLENRSFFGCKAEAFDKIDVRGKIVMCLDAGIEGGRNVANASGVAMITANGYYTTFSEPHVLPAVFLSIGEMTTLVQYYREANGTNQSLHGTITFEGTDFENNPAPIVSYFSARGPSKYNGGILKPDIFAPGQNILAACPYTVGPNGSKADMTDYGFNFNSGTSMSTPHVSGIAALIKNIHPQWSPAAIKSALMTTATWLASDQNEFRDAYDNSKADFYATGAGHVNPEEAWKPGLIYELKESDYISYLCGLNYSDGQVTKFTKQNTNCSVQTMEVEQLNYPSISISIGYNSTKTITRTLTNVENSGSSYTSEVPALKGVAVDVSPGTLEFEKHKATASFNVTFSTKGQPKSTDEFAEGRLVWTDKKHYVSTPVIVTFI